MYTYSQIVAHEGGFQLNSVEAREAIASAMSYLNRYGKKDRERHRSTDTETLTHMLILHVEDHTFLKPSQKEKLAERAPQWAMKAYSDGRNSQE